MRARSKPLALAVVAGLVATASGAHEGTRPEHPQIVLAQASLSETAAATAQLRVSVVDDASDAPVASNIRVRPIGGGAPIVLAGLWQRNGWHVLPGPRGLAVPRARLLVEAWNGLETEVASAEVDARGGDALLELRLVRFYDAASRGLRSANTHLHIGWKTLDEARRYLAEVPRADALDFVWLSHLERVGETEKYVSNQINARDRATLLPPGRLRFGVELRHNLAAYAIGYGHALLLDLPTWQEPASLGPILTGQGGDETPLRGTLGRARSMGASAIWAHASEGSEDIPSWLAGRLDAQNMFDGGPEGVPHRYEDALYRYLDLGLSVPLSTGTDWEIGELSRAFVLVDSAAGPDDGAAWLRGLREGRSFITNGPLLELEADGISPGSELRAEPGQVIVARARALGRQRFARLELLLSGQVVAAAEPVQVGGHYEAVLETPLAIAEAGWLAARIDAGDQTSELSGGLFAHTSAIPIVCHGKRRFSVAAAEAMALEMDWNRRRALRVGVFSDAAATADVSTVYEDAIDSLTSRLPWLARIRVRCIQLVRWLRDWLQ